MGAEYLFYMKSIETHARAFLALIILGIGTVVIFFPFVSFAQFGNHEIPNSWIGELGNHENIEHV